jgi:aminobenzoyl-glutamate utilization protein B
MIVAAKTIALSAADLFEDANALAEARAAFDKARAGREYRSRIPAEQSPPLGYRDSPTSGGR